MPGPWWDSDWNPGTWARKIAESLVGSGKQRGMPTTAGIQAPGAPQIGPATLAYTNLDQMRQASQPAPDPYQEALARIQKLKEMAYGSAAPMSQQQMMSQASMEAGLQYDPQINAVERLIAKGRSETNNQQKVIAGTYKDLEKMYAQDVPISQKDTKANSEAEKARLADLKSGIRDDYTSSMSAISDQLAQLGIQSAAPDVLNPLAQDMGEYQMQGTQESANQQQAIQMQGAANTDYLRSGGVVSRLTGAEQSDKLSKAFQDFMFEQQGNIAQLQAQRANAQYAALNSYQQQQSKAQDDAWSKILQISGMENDLISQHNKLTNPTSSGYGKGLTAASKYLADHFAGTQWQQTEPTRYTGILQQLIVQLGGSGNTYTPEQMIAQADAYARDNGISPSALTRAMAAYLGKL